MLQPCADTQPSEAAGGSERTPPAEVTASGAAAMASADTPAGECFDRPRHDVARREPAADAEALDPTTDRQQIASPPQALAARARR